jgi:hypothetical protein
MKDGHKKTLYFLSFLSWKTLSAKICILAKVVFFVEEFDQFLLVRHPERQKTAVHEGLTALDPEIVYQVNEHRSYIFDDLSLGNNSKSNQTRDNAIFAAFVVHNPDKRWIFVFTF